MSTLYFLKQKLGDKTASEHGENVANYPSVCRRTVGHLESQSVICNGCFQQAVWVIISAVFSHPSKSGYLQLTVIFLLHLTKVIGLLIAPPEVQQRLQQ